MITKDNFKDVLRFLEFNESGNTFTKSYRNGLILQADFDNKQLIYPTNQGMKVNDQSTCNFHKNENFVVFECVHRLLIQGYKPEHIELEPKWQLGHEQKGGKADILIKDYQGDTLLIIECKTAGNELTKAWNQTQQDGGQLFSYVKQTSTTKFICLYASDWIDDTIKPKYYLISLVDNDGLINELRELNNESVLTYSESKLRNVEDIFDTWKQTYQSDYTTRGLFEEDIQPYLIGKNKFTLQDLETISSRDIQGKYNEFATIMRQHNVSGRENAFDKLVNLFLCKIVDETNNPDDLKFYWKGISYDSPFDLQDRLQSLYQQGMKKFLNEEVTYVRESEVEKAFRFYKNDPVETQRAIKAMFRRLKFFTNNDLAFIDVHNERLFQQNSEVLLKIVKMLQDMRLRTNEENQFLGDMFEGFLDQGVKQSEGQFFTPMPIVKFLMKSLPIEEIITESEDIPKVIDYACGAGHFLNEYASTIRPIIEAAEDKELSAYYDSIMGIEKEYRLSKVAKVSAFMYGQDDINIIYADALGKNETIENNSYSVLVANPPYSVKGFLDTLTPSERKQYELIKCIDEKSYTVNNSIETFFIERAKQLLKTGGVASIIVPSSILSKGKASSTSSSKNIYVATREILLKYFDIVAIAEFGKGTFSKTGTNTVTLFLRRKETNPPTQDKHLKERVNHWFSSSIHVQTSTNSNNKCTPIDSNTVFDDIHWVDTYCQHLSLDVNEYKTLLAGKPSQTLLETDYFLSYKKSFEKWSEIKKLKEQETFKNLLEEDKQKELYLRFTNYLQNNEKDKLYYFVLASLNPQPVVIVKSPSKIKDIKAFLGYEWSSAKGNEGIKYIGGVHIDDIDIGSVDEDSGEIALEEEDKRVLSNLYNLDNIDTPLYDPHNKNNRAKINYLISQNFLQQDIIIPEALEGFVTTANLVDMLDFEIVDFNKAISLTPKIDFTIETKWDTVVLGDVVDVLIGGTPSRSNNSYYNGHNLWVSISEMNGQIITDTKEKITDKGVEKSNVKLIPKGTTLLSFKLSIGKTAIAGEDLYTNEAIAGLIPKVEVDLLDSYIFQIFNSGVIPLIKSGLNTFGQSLNKTFLEDIVNIPLPPLDVQQEISDAGGIIDAEVNQARHSIETATKNIENAFIESLTNPTKQYRLNDSDNFTIGIGKRLLANEINDTFASNLIPVFSANVLKPFGYINRAYFDNYNQPSVLWGIDGDWMVNFLSANQPFFPTDHCGYIRVQTDEVNPKYLSFLLQKAGEQERFSRHHRASSERIKNLSLSLPDIQVQNEVIDKIMLLETEIAEAQAIIDASQEKKRLIIQSYL